MTDSVADRLCLLRGGGDLATGVVWRLTKAGFPVVVTELEHPLTVRRSVSLSSAVTEGVVDIEGMVGRLASTPDEAKAMALDGDVGVVVSPGLPALGAEVVVDARLAKRNIDTRPFDADLVIGLGPGFTVGEDCHAVIETNRGPDLGRVLWDGSAEANTGRPGPIAGRAGQRVLRAPHQGLVLWSVAIGDRVTEGQRMGSVTGREVIAPFDGVVRGLILDGSVVPEGLKIGDVDPRLDTDCHRISDKALSVGGGVVEAVFTGIRRP